MAPILVPNRLSQYVQGVSGHHFEWRHRSDVFGARFQAQSEGELYRDHQDRGGPPQGLQERAG